MRKRFPGAIAAALAVATSSSPAVVLSPRGTGQVLIYPYYTVNHQQTLLSVVNTTGHGKALRARFREGYDGREVAGFNVYLGPHDSWVGAVFDASADGGGAAAVATSDNSCAVPAFDATFFPGGGGVLTFSNKNYSQGDYGTPTGTDSGPVDLARTREGFFEIIEMGEVVDQASGSQATLEAITPVNGTPPGCAQVQSAWASGGYWTTNAKIDLLPPAGGLYGSAGIVDVAQGTLYAYDATAIDGFSDVAQHTGPGDPKPNLSTAVTDSAHGIATAYVPIGNAMIKADYPAATRGVDAVSAVLMTDMVSDDYDVEAGLGAATDWVLASPTKQFYVDPGIVGPGEGNVLAPFEQLFGGGLSNGSAKTPGAACSGSDPSYFDRDGQASADAGCGLLCPISPGPYLCYEDTIVAFEGVWPVEASRALGSELSPTTLTFGYHYPDSGRLDLRLDDSAEGLRPALNGVVFRGLPLIGFAATNYVNANVTPGVLSNYSGTHAHRLHTTCVDSGGQPCRADYSAAVTFSPLTPAPAGLAISPNPINAGTGAGSIGTVTYSAAYASACSVSSSSGRPIGGGTCPAVSLGGNTSCTGSGSPPTCSGSGTVIEPVPLAGPSSCNYTLTATCNPGGVTSSTVLSVVPAGGGSGGVPAACQSLAPIGTGTQGQYWSQVQTTTVKFGDGATVSGVDATSYVAVWDYPGTDVPWPGSAGLTTRPSAPVNQYFAEKFVVPTDGSVTGHPNWSFSGSGFNSNMSLTISICPGDFGQTGTQLTNATGCAVGQAKSSSGLTAAVSATQLGSYCSLAPGGTYYLNLLPMANLPVNDVSVSDCTGICTPWLGRH